jgi:ABC-type glycerol-3-phosphate transport system substrate-binding protein
MTRTRADVTERKNRHKIPVLAALTGLLAVGTTVTGPVLSAGATDLPALGHIGGSLTVWSEWTSAEQSDFQASIQAFESETGITVNYRGIGSNIAATVQAAVAGGKGPDVAFVPSPATLDALAAKGQIKPISSVVGSLASKNYAPVWNQLASYNGKLYGIWFKAANKNTIWYNPAEFAVAGIKTPPTTWQGLIADAATLHAAGVVPVSFCSSIGWPIADMWQNIYLKTAGAADYNKLANHQIPWTDPTVTTAFDTMAELVGKPQYLLGGTAGALSASTGNYPECADQVFPKPGTTPKAAMVIEADFVVAEIVSNSSNYAPGTKGAGGKACTANPADTPCYDFFPFPAPAADKANSSALQGSGDVAMMINSTPQAKAFMQYIASPLPGEIWARIGGFASPNKGVPLSTYPDPVSKADASELQNATSFVFSLDDLQSWEPSLWQDMLNFVKNPSASNISTIESTMQQQATTAKQS